MKSKILHSGKPSSDFEKLHLSGKELGELVKTITDKGFCVSFIATGMSMLPIIVPGMSVTITPYNARRPIVGDISAYIDQKSNSLICHRIIKHDKNFFTARGDNCSSPDPEHPIPSLLGHVSDISPIHFRFQLLNCRFSKVILTFLNLTGILYKINRLTQRKNEY